MNNQTIKPVMIETAPLEWVSINSSADLPLSTEEHNRATLRKLDLEKVAIVKALLLKGKSPSSIHKQTGIARSTVYTYKNILDEETLENINTIRAKYNKNTPNNYSVVSIALFSSELGNQTTVWFLIFALPLFLLGGELVKRKWKAYQIKVLLYQQEAAHLHFLYLAFLDYSFRKDIIIAQTEKQRAWYRKLLVHFKNGSRPVELLPKQIGETWHEYDRRREQFRRYHNEQHREKIKQGEARLSAFAKEQKESGHLDFFSGYKKGNWLQSKVLWYSKLDYLIQHPEPAHGHYKTSNPLKFIPSK